MDNPSYNPESIGLASVRDGAVLKFGHGHHVCEIHWSLICAYKHIFHHGRWTNSWMRQSVCLCVQIEKCVLLSVMLIFCHFLYFVGFGCDLCYDSISSDTKKVRENTHARAHCTLNALIRLVIVQCHVFFFQRIDKKIC